MGANDLRGASKTRLDGSDAAFQKLHTHHNSQPSRSAAGDSLAGGRSVARTMNSSVVVLLLRKLALGGSSAAASCLGSFEWCVGKV